MRSTMRFKHRAVDGFAGLIGLDHFGRNRAEFLKLKLFFVFLRLVVNFVEFPALDLAEIFGFVGGDQAVVRQTLRVLIGHRALRADFAIENRLRVAGIVGLVVAVFAIAHHVDHGVLMEPLAVIERHLRGADAGFRIVGVHVKHGKAETERDVGAIFGRTAVSRVGGESDLVVYHEVDRSAGGVAFDGGEIHRLGDHSLAGHRCVAVNQQRDHSFAGGVIQAILLGPRDPFRHRIHGLQVARIERDRHDDHAARGRSSNSGCAQVILHVALALERFRIHRAVEFRKELHHALADDIGKRAEASAMRHPDHTFDHVG